MALAHTINNKVEAAYRRGDLLEYAQTYDRPRRRSHIVRSMGARRARTDSIFGVRLASSERTFSASRGSRSSPCRESNAEISNNSVTLADSSFGLTNEERCDERMAEGSRAGFG
jgi:hypothetical protein